MDNKEWIYYNHAAIPTTPLNIEPKLDMIMNRSIWKMQGKPILARWTSDFDCGYETEWWYVIKEKPFEVDKLPAKKRKHIRQAQKKCKVQKIIAEDYIDDLYQCYLSACERYINQDNYMTKELFVKDCQSCAKEGMDYWAAFSLDTGKLIGYMMVSAKGMYAETLIAKYASDSLHLRASDAIHYRILEYYLNELGYMYVSSGSRNINHKTKVQEYKIETFGYRKAYCKLHIVYNPKIEWIIHIAYRFRCVLYRFDQIRFIHQINAILKMEECARQSREV